MLGRATYSPGHLAAPGTCPRSCFHPGFPGRKQAGWAGPLLRGHTPHLSTAAPHIPKGPKQTLENHLRCPSLGLPLGILHQHPASSCPVSPLMFLTARLSSVWTAGLVAREGWGCLPVSPPERGPRLAVPPPSSLLPDPEALTHSLTGKHSHTDIILLLPYMQDFLSPLLTQCITHG